MAAQTFARSYGQIRPQFLGIACIMLMLSAMPAAMAHRGHKGSSSWCDTASLTFDSVPSDTLELSCQPQGTTGRAPHGTAVTFLCVIGGEVVQTYGLPPSPTVTVEMICGDRGWIRGVVTTPLGQIPAQMSSY